jgi:hypothetical protein
MTNYVVSILLNHYLTSLTRDIVDMVRYSYIFNFCIILLVLVVLVTIYGFKEHLLLSILHLPIVRLISIPIIDMVLELDLEIQGFYKVEETDYYNLIVVTDSIEGEFISWDNTQALANGIEGLNRMYNV